MKQYESNKDTGSPAPPVQAAAATSRVPDSESKFDSSEDALTWYARAGKKQSLIVDVWSDVLRLLIRFEWRQVQGREWDDMSGLDMLTFDYYPLTEAGFRPDRSVVNSPEERPYWLGKSKEGKHQFWFSLSW
jgi:hypothetical protein